MYCRKCLSKGDRVNMKVDSDEGCYNCPSCNDVVIWMKQGDFEDEYFHNNKK
jgi:hypothetical protein